MTRNAMLFLLALSSTAALAQPQGFGPQHGPQSKNAQSPMSFAELKAEALHRLAERQHVLAQAKECVGAATTKDELRSCAKAARESHRDAMHRRSDAGFEGARGPRPSR